MSSVARFADDAEGLENAAKFCAELVRQGIRFEMGRDGRGWYVEMTGY